MAGKYGSTGVVRVWDAKARIDFSTETSKRKHSEKASINCATIFKWKDNLLITTVIS